MISRLVFVLFVCFGISMFIAGYTYLVGITKCNEDKYRGEQALKIIRRLQAKSNSLKRSIKSVKEELQETIDD